MPDVRKLPGGLYEYSCGRCGRAITNTNELTLKVRAGNLFRNKLDFILICRQCGAEMFPHTRIFEREDCQ